MSRIGKILITSAWKYPDSWLSTNSYFKHKPTNAEIQFGSIFKARIYNYNYNVTLGKWESLILCTLLFRMDSRIEKAQRKAAEQKAFEIMTKTMLNGGARSDE